MELCLKDIIKAVNGKCLNEEQLDEVIIKGISTDSRSLGENSLFVPLKGERFDGHAFINTVYDKGAIATLTMEEKVDDPRLCTIVVKDTGKALLDLAAYYRSLFPIPVIGVTGSVGKTSTKEIISAILSGKYNVHKTEGNFNNEIGLPLTLFKLNSSHQVAVVEMGMNHFGEIHNLSTAAQPDIAVITNVGTSHIENLGSREGILKAKLEILDGLKQDGLLVVCADNDLLGQINEPKHVKMVRYGFDANKPYYATHITAEGEYTSAHIVTPSHEYDIKINALGEHMIYNTLAGIAIAEHLGLTEEEIKKGLLNYAPAKMRMHIKQKGDLTLIDDTYNASLDSMKAALKVLKDYYAKGRRVAVLGDMLETGDFAKSLHEEVGAYAAEIGIDVVYAVGTLAKDIYEGCQKAHMTTSYYFETKEKWLEKRKELLKAGDIILFKASRGMHFEELMQFDEMPRVVGKVKEDGK